MCTGLVLNQFSDAAGWSLSTRLGVRVLEEVGQHMIGVGSLMSSKDGLQNSSNVSNSSNILYATFRTLDVMSVFKKHKYKNHLCISSEFVKFMASNSGLESIKKLEIQVKLSSRKLKTASAKAATASNKADQLTKDLFALIKRVKVLE